MDNQKGGLKYINLKNINKRVKTEIRLTLLWG